MSRECKTCKETLSLDKFRNTLKSCKKCNYNKGKCEHGTAEDKCKKCGGSGICEHEKQRSNCPKCNTKLSCYICKTIHVSKSSKFHPLCEECFCNEYPDSPLIVNYKIKERHLFDELRKRFSDVVMNINRKVEGGRSQKKPDVLIDKQSFSIIIECDENQHVNYDCENERIIELSKDLGNRPLVVIRFNPDKYIIDGKKYEGCFQEMKKGLYEKRFYKLIEYEWLKRIDVLEDTLKKYLTMTDLPTEKITIEKLFYDGYVCPDISNNSRINKVKKYLTNSYIVYSFLDEDLNLNLSLIKDGTTSYVKIVKGEILHITKAEFEKNLN